MIAELKSEYLKLRTVRSATVLALVSAALAALVAFWPLGYKAGIGNLSDPQFLYNNVSLVIGIVSIFPAIVAVLQVTHEYRYNTILHTLTATNNRLKTLLAKWLVATGYAVGVGLLVVVVTIGASILGVQLQTADMAPQSLELAKLLGTLVLYSWAFVSFSLIFAFIIRNQAAAILTLLVWPGVVESILSLVLKDNAKYLPFRALDGLFNPTGTGAPFVPTLSFGIAVVTVVTYIVVAGAVVAYTFNRRDAN